MNKGDIYYFARIIPNVGVYDVCEIIVRTVGDTWFVGCDKSDKRAYIFSYNDLNKRVFENRLDALTKVLNAEENKKEVSTEVDYEEY